jgi:hypothetical protein
MEHDVLSISKNNRHFEMDYDMEYDMSNMTKNSHKHFEVDCNMNNAT